MCIRDSEYPYRDKQEKEDKNRLRGMAYQGTLSSNKSLNRFVFAIGSAPIFSLYSVNKDNIDKSFEFVGEMCIRDRSGAGMGGLPGAAR